eukprot:CAMPEP_0119551752 /NCGR_PEP_ID=MMETSP1352-20130426/4924_1 /TAXON_ID=265584 /ORGANISM="Stauroneis constricta, Strain CCMP1120" /LENGTH=1017 /DNA_ID=CAMNT_0007597865 /DNA_START=161 /DNA_END=3214 /DNA_ORIENTATION=-
MASPSETPMSTMASALIFGTTVCATCALATRAYLTGDQRPFQAAGNPRSSALNVRSMPSMYTLLYHSSVFGFILFYAYICEKHPPFAHMGKNYDADQFFFLTALLFVVSFYTVKIHVKPKPAAAQNGKKADESELELRNGGTADASHGHQNGHAADSAIKPVAEANDATEILNRDQTEEWKGWMQFMFLLYHYFHAEEVYNSIRIMITCYVWMTGFGNFSFFYLKADYGIVRVLQMLWRLNFLVGFLCLTQGTTYILYYICLLHTYFFFMVYVTMRLDSSINYTKWGIRIKLGILGLIIFCVWDLDSGLFRLFHLPFFGTTPMLGATGGSMWEWYFRSTLDHWSTFLGMIFALNFPITSLFYRKLEAQSLTFQILAKGSMGLALLVAFGAWAMGPFRAGKIEYNQTNAYFGFIPLITYIYFRNLTPWLRGRTFELLHQIGKTTLETYLMQHHIWLTSNAKSLLTLVPGWPKLNFLLVSILYVVLSRRLYQLTLFLRGMMLPDDKAACYRNLAGLAATVGACYGIVYAMSILDVLSLEAVGILSVVFGVAVYHTVISRSVDAGNDAGAAAIATAKSGSVRKGLGGITPIWTGAFIVVIVGIFWKHMIATGARTLQPLPSTCSQYVNNGVWMPMNGCEEGERHAANRVHSIYTESLCSSTDLGHLWAWDDVPSNSYCRFTHRDSKTIKKGLRGRNVLFVGDSITRHVYHSFSRQLGVPDAGKYNATAEKHVDIDRNFGNLDVNFQWAAYITDLIDKLKAIKSPASDDRKHPDVVIMGGGAWDKLWHYSTDEEKAALASSVQVLVTEMKRVRELGIPVVWMTPTTINTLALPEMDGKPTKISENEMKIVRALYKSKGVESAATLVVDGPVFTESRVNESYDGVHYPLQVYSAGSQILANALDWLVSPVPLDGPPPPKQPGEMAHPNLGLMILCFTLAGLIGFDGFMGFSYVASIFVPSVSPNLLYYEAFSTLHRKKKLPELKPETGHHVPPPIQRSESSDGGEEDVQPDEEAASLLNKES